MIEEMHADNIGFEMLHTQDCNYIIDTIATYIKNKKRRDEIRSFHTPETVSLLKFVEAVEVSES